MTVDALLPVGESQAAGMGVGKTARRPTCDRCPTSKEPLGLIDQVAGVNVDSSRFTVSE